MNVAPFFRKLGLTAHITFSVGWFGAVAGFLALSIAGLTSQDLQVARASYISMELISWFIILPACFGALLTGIIQSMITKWGLFLHYWVFIKLLLTVIATVVLLLHMRPISLMGDFASQEEFSISGNRGLRIQLIADAGAALLILLVALTLSVYKPWGRISWGVRSQNIQQKSSPVPGPSTMKRLGFRILIGLIALVILLFIILHITGVMGGHH